MTVCRSVGPLHLPQWQIVDRPRTTRCSYDILSTLALRKVDHMHNYWFHVRCKSCFYFASDLTHKTFPFTASKLKWVFSLLRYDIPSSISLSWYYQFALIMLMEDVTIIVNVQCSCLVPSPYRRSPSPRLFLGRAD